MKNKAFVQTCFYYSFIFMATSGLAAYMSLFFAAMNQTDTQIGILTSIGAVVGIIASPFWGIRGDRANSKNNVLAICLLLSAAVIWLLPLFGKNFFLLLLAMIIFSFFRSAINPLSDAISLELATKENFQFSKVRTAGSLGFAIMSMVAGMMIEIHINAIFIIYTLLITASFFVLLRLPQISGYQKEAANINFFQVLKSPSLKKIYLYVLVLSTSFGFFGAFHALYSVQEGISVGLLGVGVMLGSFSQFPFMLFFDKLYRKFGIRNIIIVAGIFNAIRWLLYAYWLNSVSILFLWLLHGGSFILVYLSIAEYVHRYVQKELKVSGQMMNAIILQGAGQILGGIAGGFSAGLLGYGVVFGAMGVLCIAGVLFFVIATRKNPTLIDH
ncbi:MFS transporter [Saliterribacillus persicus]|uniref:PPP family 3-phenylpropionic acid transporter n=1 Tax=Saliterribacillus persicus TaxID=930114 RepID=A0A368YB35_9BACI|nr:MFS transporter [Saliterribacillus persicus]RCW76909.1 PPP family 3-phenylpropionic acid transporter [Saliterribacillus persicus]